ncbi:MAG: DinB family protein [Planctomycetaceae bacterium]|nr:DinB family protein [Planctomycetaceae bacterium]
MPSPIARYLDLLDDQREAIFRQVGALPDAVLWYRPGPRVWSIGEHLDHTRVINCFARRLMIAYFPLASIFAHLFRRRPYEAEIDDVYKRPGFPMNVGWIWPPKYTPWRPVSVGFLHEALRAEHAAYRRFYTTRDEQLLGHVVPVDPVIGALNLVQWLRVQGYHDAHHYERVRVRINDPEYARTAAAAGEQRGERAEWGYSRE